MQIRFLHAAKCGGTTLQHYLRTHVHEREFVFGEHVYKDAPIGLSDVWTAKIIHDPIGFELDTPWRQATLFTYRDPVERCLSAIKMVGRWKDADPKSVREDRLFQAVRAGVASIESETVFVQALVNNGLFRAVIGTRLSNEFSNWQAEIGRVDIVPNELLDLAIERINNFEFVLPMDQISEAAHLASCFTENGKVYDVGFFLNKYDTCEEVEVLSPGDIAAIKKQNVLDCILYDVLERRSNSFRDNIDRYRKAISQTRHIDFFGPVPMSNVWPREVNGAKASVWTASGGSKLHLNCDSERRLYVVVNVTNFIDMRQLYEASVFINGASAPFSLVDSRAGGKLMVIPVNADPDRGALGSTVLHIDAPTCLPPDRNDRRELGLEISGISIVADAA